MRITEPAQLLDKRLSLALLDRHDKQSFREIVPSTVEPSRFRSTENRIIAEGTGSNRWPACLSHKEWCSKEEAQTERGGQGEDFSDDESPLEKVQGAEGQEVINYS